MNVSQALVKIFVVIPKCVVLTKLSVTVQQINVARSASVESVAITFFAKMASAWKTPVKITA